MEPYISSGRIVVPDRSVASTLMNKGSYGQTLKGGGMSLTPLEASYLLESGRITVAKSKGGDPADLSHLIKMGISKEKRFMERYMAYRDLRNRGLVIQGNGMKGFLAYPRGQRPGSGRADSWIVVYRENDKVTLQGLFAEALAKGNMRMRFLAAIVDGDWDITYYEISIPESFANSCDDPGVMTETIWNLKEERLDIPGGGSATWDPAIAGIHRDRFVGSELGEGLLLSREETEHLLRGIEGGKDDRDLKEIVYSTLVDRGWYVRTGFKYGTHYRVYTSHPSSGHSKLLVHCMDRDEEITWEQLSRAIRLSHSVNKTMVLGFTPRGTPHHIVPGAISFLALWWIRP